MALRPCTECGKDISDQAPTCPHCGAPRQPAPVSTPAPRGQRRTTSVLFAILGLLVVFSAWRLAQPTLETAGVVPAARWAVDNAGGNDGCTVLGDYCMRVRCAVTNIGNKGGAAQVNAELHPDRGPVVTKRSTVTLGPNQRDTLSFDFFEAEMSRQYKYTCSANPV